MLRILRESGSSGTGQSQVVSVPLQEEPMPVLAWNTAVISAFVQPTPTAVAPSPRPLSKLAELAVDLGPADLSTTFRARR